MNNNNFNPHQENEMRRREKAALLIGFVFSKQLQLYPEQLTTGWKQKQAIEHLLENWSIKDTDSAINQLDYFIDEGERAAYHIIIPSFLSADNKKARRETLEKLYLSVNRLIKYSDNLSDCLPAISQYPILRPENTNFEKGTLAWDMALLVTITRLSFDANYLKEEEAWNYINLAYTSCLDSFANWQEVGKSFILGDAMYTGYNTLFTEKLTYLHDALINKESSLNKTGY